MHCNAIQQTKQKNILLHCALFITNQQKNVYFSGVSGAYRGHIKPPTHRIFFKTYEGSLFTHLLKNIRFFCFKIHPHFHPQTTYILLLFTLPISPSKKIPLKIIQPPKNTNKTLINLLNSQNHPKSSASYNNSLTNTHTTPLCPSTLHYYDISHHICPIYNPQVLIYLYIKQ